MTTTDDLPAFLDALLARHGNNPTNLLQILCETQERQGWIAPPTITYLAQRLGIPRARIEGVASFYSFLHLRPNGEYRVLLRPSGTEPLLRVMVEGEDQMLVEQSAQRIAGVVRELATG